jgi:hypothetical protein
LCCVLRAAAHAVAGCVRGEKAVLLLFIFVLRAAAHAVAGCE